LVRVAQLEDLHHIRTHHVEVVFAPDERVPVDAIRAAAGVEDVKVEGRRVTCTVRGSFDSLFHAIRDAKVTDLVSTEPSLEEIFLSYYSTDVDKHKALPG
jgi:ABC-2 type transport system ATP-binding protein